MREIPISPKSLWKSKTFWFNAITVLVVVLTYIVDNQDILPFSNKQIIVEYAVFILGIGNLLLRLWTNAPLKGTPGKYRAIRKHIDNTTDSVREDRAVENAANNLKNDYNQKPLQRDSAERKDYSNTDYS